MSGAGGQTTLMIPSHDLVVARLGHYRGESAGTAGFNKALALLMEAVPKAQRLNPKDFEGTTGQAVVHPPVEK